jgi:hypothetical protein
MSRRAESCEGKEGKERSRREEEADEDAPAPDVVDVSAVRFVGESALCPVEAALAFRVEFMPLRTLRRAHWQVKYMVDTVAKRQIIGACLREGRAEHRMNRAVRRSAD